MVHGKGMGNGAPFPVGSYDHDPIEFSQDIRQEFQSMRVNAVIIGNQNHRFFTVIPFQETFGEYPENQLDATGTSRPCL